MIHELFSVRGLDKGAIIIHEYNPKGKKVYGAGETAYVRFEPGSAHCI